MQDFSLYFTMGWEHILDWRAYDHLLFLASLCGVYLLSHWRRVIILVTAFTLGHCLTLALSVLNHLPVSSAWIEFLIPLTIIFTAINNLINKVKHPLFLYLMPLFFGLIHGLGFSNYLKSLMGGDTSIVSQLLSFNLGLELGQLIIVITILALAQLIVKRFKVPHREWIIFLSAASFGIALQMALERFMILKF